MFPLIDPSALVEPSKVHLHPTACQAELATLLAGAARPASSVREAVAKAPSSPIAVRARCGVLFVLS